MKNREPILVTGGFGFMGSDFIRHLLEETQYFIVNLDTLTYAANKNNLVSHRRVKSYVIDICDREFVEKLFKKYKFPRIVHFAADTHVDRSIGNPLPFLHSNVEGTVTLLEVLKKYPNSHFHYVSTDEVYGDLTSTCERFKLGSPLKPSSPYSASKASADMFCSAYVRTYGLNITISRSGNNYGPYQNEEKLIPSMVRRALVGDNFPLYGDGTNVRDWIYVTDHSRAILKILQARNFGQVYHIGSGEEMTNIKVCEMIKKEVEKQLGHPIKSTIEFVEDRMGHDYRYSLDVCATNKELGFKCLVEFKTGMEYIIKYLIERIDGQNNLYDSRSA